MQKLALYNIPKDRKDRDLPLPGATLSLGIMQDGVSADEFIKVVF